MPVSRMVLPDADAAVVPSSSLKSLPIVTNVAVREVRCAFEQIATSERRRSCHSSVDCRRRQRVESRSDVRCRACRTAGCSCRGRPRGCSRRSRSVFCRCITMPPKNALLFTRSSAPAARCSCCSASSPYPASARSARRRSRRRPDRSRARRRRSESARRRRVRPMRRLEK